MLSTSMLRIKVGTIPCWFKYARMELWLDSFRVSHLDRRVAVYLT